MSNKLTRSERERIVFNHIKGIDDPLYDVQETKYGKWLVKPKQIQIEEEEEHQEPEPVSQIKPTNDKQEAKRERRRRNRRAKQDAKRILDALTNLISSNNDDDESIDDQQQQPQPHVMFEQQANNVPTRKVIKRRVLRFT